MEKTERQLLTEISEKLDNLIGIMAIQGRDKDEQVKILTSLEFSNALISKVTGIPKGTVDTTRARIKKGKKK